MAAEGRSAIEFYSRHPITAALIRKRLSDARGHLDALGPDELFAHDQDHYGGLAANDALAERGRITTGSRVVDFCAGLGGPARYFAHRFGADVTGVELTPARVADAIDLTRLVGLENRVRIAEGDVMAAPLPDASADAVISQEALLHVPDKARALGEAFRVLRRGGRIAFTDWVVHRPLTADDATILAEGMAARNLQNVSGYRDALSAAGFVEIVDEDLTLEWGPILEARFAMYRRLRDEAEKAGTPAGDDPFYRSYERLVALVLGRSLGGARFSATKP